MIDWFKQIWEFLFGNDHKKFNDDEVLKWLKYGENHRSYPPATDLGEILKK